MIKKNYSSTLYPFYNELLNNSNIKNSEVKNNYTMQTLSLHQFPCKAHQFLLLSGFLLLKWFIYFSDNGVTVAIKISV